MSDDFFEKGWVCFDPEPCMLDWALDAMHHLKAAVQNPENKHFHECDGTWFVGLDVLPNDKTGRVPDGTALRGRAVDVAAKSCGGWPDLHRAQISVIYPGYPKPRAGENEAGFGYRLRRDGAYVDGVLGIGTPKRRFVKEPHAFILGIPLTQASPEASPLVVWEGSHHIMRAALAPLYAGLSAAQARAVDITEVYQEARREVFETCTRVPLPGAVGSTVLVHRLALHGVAPWGADARAAPEGRAIAYFRPELAGGLPAWLSMP